MQDVFCIAEGVGVGEGADGEGGGVDVCGCHIDWGAGVGRRWERARAGEELVLLGRVVWD